MQDLKELVQIITPNKLRSIELLDLHAEGASKLREFYEGIADGTFESDADAADHFYGEDETYSTYQSLRNNLKNRLTNALFLINTKQASYTERQRAFYECNREWAAAKILLANNARISGIALGHKILKIAKKYDFSDLVLDISRMLRLHYGTREGNPRKFNRYNELFKKFEEIWAAENLAEEYYVQLLSGHVKNREQGKSMHDEAAKYYKEIQPAVQKYESYRLQFSAILLQMIQYNSIGDHENTIAVCAKGVELFENKPYRADTPIQNFLIQKLVCHIQLKQFEEGKQTAEKCLGLAVEGHFNWFKFQELFFLLSMHSQEYVQAHRTLQYVIHHPRFQFLPEFVQELWRIFQAYMHFLVKIGQVDLTEEEIEKSYSKFRLGRFLNNTPTFSKDRRGVNIPILVVHILFMILEKRHDEAIEKIEAIKKYCSRYLVKGSTFRNNCFIKMLLVIPESAFNRIKTEREVQKYRVRLDENPLNVTNQTHEIEIIPYEELWDLTVELLDNNTFYDPD